MSLVQVKDFNSLIENKQFFDQSIKKTKETCEKLAKMSRNNDYATVGLDLSRQINTSILRLINFTEKLEEGDGAIMFLLFKTSKNL